MDDKAKIPIGEPGTPEAATRHMRKAITTKKVTLESSDHNYHSVNMTSSVNLICDIPDSIQQQDPFIVDKCLMV